jgi:hypothetical protein
VKQPRLKGGDFGFIRMLFVVIYLLFVVLSYGGIKGFSRFKSFDNVFQIARDERPKIMILSKLTD